MRISAALIVATLLGSALLCVFKFVMVPIAEDDEVAGVPGTTGIDLIDVVRLQDLVTILSRLLMVG